MLGGGPCHCTTLNARRCFLEILQVHLNFSFLFLSQIIIFSIFLSLVVQSLSFRRTNQGMGDMNLCFGLHHFSRVTWS